jgi:hypothetical protein
VRALVVLGLLASVARADDVADLVAQGEELAKQGEWSRAITAFKAADAKRPRAQHACLIGLAYTRREAWGEAELYLAKCRARANAGDPAPDWLEDAEHALADKLASNDVAAVTIEVDAPGARVHVSTFAPDEAFAPRTIHLAPGTHVISAEADDHEPAKQEITITGGAAQTAHFHLVAHARATASRARHLPRYLMIGGAALGGVGLAYDLLVLQPTRDRLGPMQADYDANVDSFHTHQRVTIALFAGAAAAVAAGVTLRFTVYAEPARSGAVVGVAWAR